MTDKTERGFFINKQVRRTVESFNTIQTYIKKQI